MAMWINIRKDYFSEEIEESGSYCCKCSCGQFLEGYNI